VREIFPREKIRENQSFDLCLLLTSLLWSRSTALQVQFSLSERLGAEILLEANPDLFADMKDQLSSKLAAEFGLSEKHEAEMGNDAFRSAGGIHLRTIR
jgi:hypothetical protein